MAAEAVAAATPLPERPARQKSHPNLLGPRWKPGESGNPDGVSPYQKLLRVAIEKKESPARVLAVINAMYEMATSGDTKGAPAAAKVYLGAVGVRLNAEPAKVDLSDLPDNVVQLIAERIR